MGYATIGDVKARAGVVARAWNDQGDVKDADIEKFIDQTAAELDSLLAAAGYTTPVVDPIAQQALVGINADRALALALDATFPGDTQATNDVRQAVQSRIDAYQQAIDDSKWGVLMYLSSQLSSSESSGASNFWTEDAATLMWWERFADRLSGWGGLRMLDPFGVPVEAGPEFHKNMRL